MPHPLPPQVLEEVQGRFVCPLEIIDKDEQRDTCGIRFSQVGQSFKEAGRIEGLVDGWRRQFRVALAQLREQAGEFGQPGIAQQLAKIIFLC